MIASSAPLSHPLDHVLRERPHFRLALPNAHPGAHIAHLPLLSEPPARVRSGDSASPFTRFVCLARELDADAVFVQ